MAKAKGKITWVGWAVVILVIVPGLGVSVAAVADQLALRARLARVQDTDPAVRAHAMFMLGNERDLRGADAVLAQLGREENRSALENGAYAAMRLRDMRAMDLLRHRIDNGPDDATRTRLLIFTARLSRRDARLADWLWEGVASGEPWRQVGSAAGLLELGMPAGGPALIELSHTLSGGARDVAADQLRQYTEPMMTTIGYAFDWPDDWPTALPAVEATFWTNLRRFYTQHGTFRLLNDVLSRQHGWDPDWYQLHRLIRARDKVARFFE